MVIVGTLKSYSLAADFGLSDNVRMDRKCFVMKAGMVDQWMK